MSISPPLYRLVHAKNEYQLVALGIKNAKINNLLCSTWDSLLVQQKINLSQYKNICTDIYIFAKDDTTCVFFTHLQTLAAQGTLHQMEFYIITKDMTSLNTIITLHDKYRATFDETIGSEFAGINFHQKQSSHGFYNGYAVSIPFLC